ncbi:MAG: hypothetical protein FWD57_05275 [Polyangiaceae bacterium]|nr:hypothetical protein [Polyangiaceae bacterium]
MDDRGEKPELLTIGWWNAGISYVRGMTRNPTRLSAVRLPLAGEVVRWLVDEYRVDFFFFG